MNTAFQQINFTLNSKISYKMLVEAKESRKQKAKYFHGKFISCINNSDSNEEAPNKFSY